MSYLDAPRLHFRGWFQADVSTINNDVRFFQNPSFVPEYQEYNQNGSWNPEGNGIFRLLDCSVTGGNLDGRRIITPQDDPVIGMLLENADQRAPGKLVDLDPQQQMVSQIWGMQVRLLDAAGKALLAGEYRPAAFCNLWRRQQQGVAGDQQLGANYQSVLDQMSWAERLDSPLLHALRAASDDGSLSIDFNVFGYGRDASIPRYTMGHVVGTIGPYVRGEPKHFVMGRQMVADTTQSPVVPAGGVFHVQGRLAPDASALTLDLGNTFPIVDANSGLADIGPVFVGVLKDNPMAPLSTVQASQMEPIGEIPYRHADWYTQTAGVQDFDLRANAAARSLLPSRPLVLFGPPGQDGSAKVLLQETIDGKYVRADDFVFRIEPRTAHVIQLHASRFGKPLAGADIAATATQGMMGGSGGGAKITPPMHPPAPIPQIGTPADAIGFSSSATTDAAGYATLQLKASSAGPGVPRGYIAGQLYGIAYQLTDLPPGYLVNPLNYISILAYSRKEVPDKPTWFGDIQTLFTQYGHLYPIMNRYVVDLTDYAYVVSRLQGLRFAFSLPMHDPNHMPVTRDMGQGDRDTIIKWLNSAGADGLPPLGEPIAAPEAAAPVRAATGPAEVALAPSEGGGKTAFLKQYLQRAHTDQTPGTGEQP